MPDVPADQFHLFSYYDPFGNNYANVGSRNLDQPGQYRIRQAPKGASYGVDTSSAGSYKAYINSPSLYRTSISDGLSTRPILMLFTVTSSRLRPRMRLELRVRLLRRVSPNWWRSSMQTPTVVEARQQKRKPLSLTSQSWHRFAFPR